jgi:hypothetical protein
VSPAVLIAGESYAAAMGLRIPLVVCTRVQSSPSNRAANSTGESLITPSTMGGQRKDPCCNCFHISNPDERHVVAAAIAAGASIISTSNLKDFPAAALKKYGLRRQTPDAFLTGLYDHVPDLVVGSLANARRNLNKSRVSASDFIEILNHQKLTQLATRIRQRPTDL